VVTLLEFLPVQSRPRLPLTV